MSRSAAARATPVPAPHRERLRPRPHGMPATRRVSGPARPQRASAAALPDTVLVPPREPYAEPRYRTAPQRPPLRLAAGGAAIALRVGETAMQVSGSRAMDRVVRSRAWVVIVGFGLIGIVAMQVWMLKLNSGIGRAVDTVATLERSNATLKADISRLSSGDRIQALAGARGFAMPEPADVTYLRAGDLRSDGFQAARRMRAPDPAVAGPAGALTAANVSGSLTGAAPAGTTATTAAPVTGQAATTTTQPPPATTDPAAATPAAATPPATPTAANGGAAAPTTATAPVTPQTTSSGGVTLP